jgi:hypothetical protein
LVSDLCELMSDLTKEQLQSVKNSYLNILALFLGQEQIDSKYLRCLLKWGFQLHLNPEDLRLANTDISSLKFERPEEKVEKAEAIYHLVYMIYLDEVVEDIELEVATIYAEKLGFKKNMVSDLFKSIATAAFDRTLKRLNVKKEVMDFLKIAEV